MTDWSTVKEPTTEQSQAPELEPADANVRTILQPVGVVLYGAIEILAPEYPGWAAMLGELYALIDESVQS